MKTTLPSGYTARPLEFSDAPAAVAMFNAYGLKVLGTKTDVVESDIAFWQTPGYDIRRDSQVVWAEDGTVAGYIEIFDVIEHHVRINSWGCVHPDHWGKGIGSYLVEWMEERAAQSVLMAPPQARVVLQHGLDARDLTAHRLFEQRGYSPVRQYWTMRIDFKHEPSQPVLPEGMVIRPMQRGVEERAFASATREAFLDHWGVVEESFETYFRRWLYRLEHDVHSDPELYLVAAAGDEIAGTVVTWDHSDEDPQLGWIATLGVRRPWRKQGVGLALLQHSFCELYHRGKIGAGLGVDSSSLTGATRLYEKAGMVVDRRQDAYEKVLRQGVDLMTQKIK